MWEASKRNRERDRNGTWGEDMTMQMTQKEHFEQQREQLAVKRAQRKATRNYIIAFWVLNIISLGGIIVCWTQGSCLPAWDSLDDTLPITTAIIDAMFYVYMTFKTGWKIVQNNAKEVNWLCRLFMYGSLMFCRGIMVLVVNLNPRCGGWEHVNNPEVETKIDADEGSCSNTIYDNRQECENEKYEWTARTRIELEDRYQWVCNTELERMRRENHTLSDLYEYDKDNNFHHDEKSGWWRYELSMNVAFGLSFLAMIAAFLWFMGNAQNAIHNDTNKMAWKLFAQMASFHTVLTFFANMAAYMAFDDAAFTGASTFMIVLCMVTITLFNWRFQGDDCGDVCSFRCCFKEEEGSEYNPKDDDVNYDEYAAPTAHTTSVVPYTKFSNEGMQGHSHTAAGYATTRT